MITVHKCDVFPIKVIVATGHPIDAIGLSSALRRRKVLARDTSLGAGGTGATATCYYLEDTGSAVISFWAKPTTLLIAHEALHAAVWLSEYLGLPTSASESETLAYVLEWIIKCVNKHVKGK